MGSPDDKHIDHAAELDDCYQSDADAGQSGEGASPDAAKPDERRSEDARQAYLRKLASGELNRIDEVD
ncbi:MAG: hypothetical protein ACYSOF_07725 [Planctomycetota bacterium]|jgi:hypothetical protein